MSRSSGLDLNKPPASESTMNITCFTLIDLSRTEHHEQNIHRKKVIDCSASLLQAHTFKLDFHAGAGQLTISDLTSLPLSNIAVPVVLETFLPCCAWLRRFWYKRNERVAEIRILLDREGENHGSLDKPRDFWQLQPNVESAAVYLPTSYQGQLERQQEANGQPRSPSVALQRRLRRSCFVQEPSPDQIRDTRGSSEDTSRSAIEDVFE